MANVTINLDKVFPNQERYNDEQYIRECVAKITKYEDAAKECWRSKHKYGDGSLKPGKRVDEMPWYRRNHTEHDEGVWVPKVNIDVPWEDLRQWIDIYRGPSLDRMEDLASFLSGYMMTKTSNLKAEAGKLDDEWMPDNRWDAPSGSAAAFFKQDHSPQILNAIGSYPDFVDVFHAIIVKAAALLNFGRGTALSLIDDAIAKFGASEQAADKAADTYQQDVENSLNSAIGAGVGGAAGGPPSIVLAAAAGLVGGLGQAKVKSSFAQAGAEPWDIHDALVRELEKLEGDFRKKSQILADEVIKFTDKSFYGQNRELCLPLGPDQ